MLGLELIIALCAAGVSLLCLGCTLIVRAAKSDKAVPEPEVAEEIAEAVEEAPIEEAPVEETPAEETAEEESETPTEEVIVAEVGTVEVKPVEEEMAEEEAFSVVELSVKDEDYLRPKAAPYGKTNITEEVVTTGEYKGEPAIIIGGDDDLILSAEEAAEIPDEPYAKSPAFDRLGTSKSFSEKMLGAEDSVKEYYDAINNEFLSYKKVRGRVSRSCASYRYKGDLLAKIVYRGKTLKLNLALKVADFDENVYHQKDVGSVKAFEQVPFSVKVKSERGLKKAIALIAALMEKIEVAKNEKYVAIDSIAQLKA